MDGQLAVLPPRPANVGRALLRVAAIHATDEIVAGPVVSMLLSVETSLILRKNRCVAHCFTLEGLAGAFRKDVADSRELGQYLCDLIKWELRCDGFFTTDELPKYGISEEHRVYINDQMGVDGLRDVTVITLYNRSLAERIRARLQEWMTVELTTTPRSVPYRTIA